MQGLFEEALVEQGWVTGLSFILQTGQQVPEIDSSDALPRKLSAACSSGPSRMRGAWAWALEGDEITN